MSESIEDRIGWDRHNNAEARVNTPRALAKFVATVIRHTRMEDLFNELFHVDVVDEYVIDAVCDDFGDFDQDELDRLEELVRENW